MQSPYCTEVALLLTLLIVTGYSWASVLNRHSADNTELPRVWSIPLSEASHLCGNGCVKLLLSDLTKKVPIQSLSIASIYFYEHGAPTDWATYSRNPEQYQISTVNRHNQTHHLISQFKILNEAFYTTSWRSADLLHRVKGWYRKHPSNTEITMVIKKVGDVDPHNTRFAAQRETPAFMLIGVPASEDPDPSIPPPPPSPSTRQKRSLSAITNATCSSTPSATEACCIATKRVDLNTHQHPTYNWWVSPRNFELKYCSGRCTREPTYYYQILNLYGHSTEPCCRRARFEDFHVDVYISGAGIQRSILKYFQPTACTCL